MTLLRFSEGLLTAIMVVSVGEALYDQIRHAKRVRKIMEVLNWPN